MKPESTNLTTRTLHVDQEGSGSLPITDIVFDVTVDTKTPAMISFWKPSPEELQQLVDHIGKAVHLLADS